MPNTAFTVLPTPWRSFRGRSSGAWMLHPTAHDGLDPFMMVDHFLMDEPTFAPHPHAGFSAVTYLLADSEGGVANRDSLGHALDIAPGGLLWTQAGRGVLHEEIPATPGRGTHGLQIFVNSALSMKNTPPQVFERHAQSIPTLALPGGGALRLVLGEFEGQQAKIGAHTQISMLDLSMPPSSSFAWTLPSGWAAMAIVVRGALAEAPDAPDVHDAQPQPQPHALRFAVPADGRLQMQAGEAGVHLVLLAAQPLREPVVSHGPFIAGSAAEISDMIRRYQAGEMGQLLPSAAALPV